uniref:Uncharacterized protein n=1 Tax=Nelumbo nucifera TaxID=4432 RepID=A0A822Z232_NELNU|nr:TPA_asm: hypothetical protein HUJ06_013062 [Nelumbo nucifera]
MDGAPPSSLLTDGASVFLEQSKNLVESNLVGGGGRCLSSQILHEAKFDLF